MEDQRSACDLNALLDELAVGLADLDCDLDALRDVEEQLTAARQAALIPRLEAHLEAAVGAGNWYARSVLAGILAETAGGASMAVLLRAWSRNLGDDQDSLTTTLSVFAQEDPVAARRILVPWAEDPDPDLRRAAIWLLGYAEEADTLCRIRQVGAGQLRVAHHLVDRFGNRGGVGHIVPADLFRPLHDGLSGCDSGRFILKERDRQPVARGRVDEVVTGVDSGNAGCGFQYPVPIIVGHRFPHGYSRNHRFLRWWFVTPACSRYPPRGTNRRFQPM